MSLRNVAIIAHVDHGKTTLVDGLLQQSGAFRSNQDTVDRAMDSNALERERGITILAKCTSLMWGETRLNIVDTPGHADFGGEVERILGMVDGVIVLVDAAEGPMPQTKFVVGKALKLGLRPIVVINKADRPDAQPDQALDAVFDLFVSLEATAEQLDFPVLYASGRNGWAVKSLQEDREGATLAALFDLLVEFVPVPTVDNSTPFSFLVSMIEADPYLGRILTGRIASGTIKAGQDVQVLTPQGQLIEKGRLTKVLAFRHLKRQPIAEAEAGDIISLAGLEQATVSYTVCALNHDKPLAALEIEPPTLSMTFSVNDSPLAGTEGTKLTSRMIAERLFIEEEGNVAIGVKESESKDTFEVSGRGELQLAILIETMRREGFELSVSRPRVLYRTDPETNQRLEPMEEVQIDVDEEFSGIVVEKMSLRKSEMLDMRPSTGGKIRFRFLAPSRGLIGYHGEFMTDTRGSGVMNRLFAHYAPYKGPISGRRNGVLIATDQGKSVAYALNNLEDRGVLFIEPGVAVYQGMIIGEHNRGNDLDVNPLKAKQLSNMRASGKDETIRLAPPRLMALEQALAYIDDDELVEITPKAIRLRKRYLLPNQRKQSEKQGA